MKPITEEQIEQVVLNAMQQSIENIQVDFTENIRKLTAEYTGTAMEPHCISIAAMSTAISISSKIVKQSLTELLVE